MTIVRVIIGSANPVKINAVRAAFNACAPSCQIQVRGIAVPSGVSRQPLTNDETHRGALNRAFACTEYFADYHVGIEGGIVDQGNQMFLIGHVIIAKRDSHIIGKGTCEEIIIPSNVAKLVRGGMHLGTANDQIYGLQNSAQQMGAEGLYTNGRITRQGNYTQACINALAVHKDKFQNLTLSAA